MTERNKREDLNDAVEDATGFNFRSLRTMWTLITAPSRVFESYVARDRETYTPALRLWLGLIGLQVFISAVWGGWEGIIRRQVAVSAPDVQALYERMAQGRPDEFFKHYGDAMGVTHPILVGGMTALSVFVLGWFRKGLSWPARLNIAMGVLTVGSVIGLAMMPMLVIPELQRWAIYSTPLIFIAYFLTFLRGAPGVLADTGLGAFVKALIYAFVLLLLIGIGGLLISVISISYATYRLSAG